MNKGHSNPRYKTTLCKKFMSTQSCPYAEKCQFAHGEQELRIPNPQLANNALYNTGMGNKGQNKFLNYKIVKCKNWEKDGTCKYGKHCTFAHGDNELRSKNENIYQMQPQMLYNPFIDPMNPGYPFMMPMIANPNMDMAQMQQLMANNQFMMPVPMNMNKPNEMNQTQNDTNKPE